MVLQLILVIICGAIAAAIASSKGRNVVGWFFGGFFLGLIGVVIVACLGNLKEQKAYRQHTENERRRLREQLRQERVKTDAFRQYSMDRLDSHDEQLGVDTRTRQQALPTNVDDSQLDLLISQQQRLGDAAAPPGTAEGDNPIEQLAGNPVAGPTQTPPADATWYYEISGQSKGPVSKHEIRMFMRSGMLNTATLVWTEGMADWTAAGEVDAFGPEVDA